LNDVDPHRLPRHATPERYELTLEPDLDAGTFAGSVAIRLRIESATERIVCNALDLEVDEAAIEFGSERLGLTARLDGELERLELDAGAELPPGPATLHLRFRGELNDKLRGFYRSRFRTDDGVERTIATTQFEATDARRAFPCWDEPEHKAVFAVTLLVPEELQAVSNTRPISDTPTGDGRRRIEFADSMKMSTYLVAFVVGPLEFTDPVDVDGVPLRVVHTPGRGHLANFALDAGAFALRYFADYYAIPYPGDKVDLVAIPDFAFGAMENLGCVTFRETLLLVDPDSVTQPELQRVTDVINHELAHMWFGDLVTMRWWNGIWLNEAFATFMEMKCTDAFRPQWQRWVDFGLSRSAAMDVDSLASTRPIEYEVRSPADAEGMFDLLTYEKGAAVVRMLEQYLGEDRFRDGIRRYLAEHAYGNTETHDLWDALEAATGEPVRRMMDTWIFQGGHPVVTVEGEKVSQKRFRYLDDGDGGATRWDVPLRVRAGEAEVRALLDEQTSTLEMPVGEVETANVDGTGFYRVRLGDDRLAQIAHDGPGGLSAIERYGLVDDTWALVLAGSVTATTYLRLLHGFREEDDLSVWQRIVGTLDSLERATGQADKAAFRAFTRSLLEPMRARLGDEPRPGEPERTAQLRGALLAAAGVLGHDASVISRCRALADTATGDPALVTAAIDVTAAHGTAEDHARFVDRMQHAASPQEEERYRYALADFPGEPEMRRTLESTLDGTIRTQDAPFIVRRALRNPSQGPTAWSFLTQRWDDLNAAIPSNLVSRMLEGVSALAEPEQASAVEAFLDEHPVPQGRTLIEQHRERLRVHVAFRARERERLGAAFATPA
jgi:puromycin-sensitive aminopeptidase